MTARCSLPVPASERDGRVELDTDPIAPGAPYRWRAVCNCGWQTGGFLQGIDAWHAIDRHRRNDQEMAVLERGFSR